MPDYQPIDCGVHDRIELACLRRYRLRVRTDDGVVEGRALTTETDNKQEWLVLEQDGGQTRIRLDRIRDFAPLD